MIYVIGIGPGGIDEITPRAFEAMKSCDVIAGYTRYVELIKKFFPDKIFYVSGMRAERERCLMALKFSREYHYDVALISSGDAGVYGMAGLMLELTDGEDVKIIPGITAANSCAAILGAPLMNDYVTVSLSDRITEWPVIVKRLISACSGDFVICVYNPASKLRPDNFMKACDIILRYYAPDTPAGYVRNMGRGEMTHAVMTLREIRDCDIDMLCTVIIGNSQTYILDGKMITSRGYHLTVSGV